MDKKPVFLIMVTEDNHNKFYNCFPEGSQFRVEYGRVDSTKTTLYYPIEKWDSQIQSKLKKGYKDISNLKSVLVEEVNKEKPRKPIPVQSIRDVIAKLESIARDTISRNYTITGAAVTQDMIDEAQSIIDNLATISNVHLFNQELMRLFSSIPRKMKCVNDYIAKTTNDFAKIITREQSLLDVMRGQVYVPSSQPKAIDNEIPNQTILDDMGIEMRECTADEIAEIKKAMNESVSHFSRAWKVVNKETQKRFDKFVATNHINDKKLLFHGSRSENWYSILKTGLKIRPANAISTGSMFGQGIYFAPKCQKSIGYTSLGGSYWANGRDSKAYMALLEVAYGKPYNVYSFDSKYYSMSYNRLPSGCNCLHAHAGSMLYNDEIVVYREEQTTIKYLIEIK